MSRKALKSNDIDTGQEWMPWELLKLLALRNLPQFPTVEDEIINLQACVSRSAQVRREGMRRKSVRPEIDDIWHISRELIPAEQVLRQNTVLGFRTTGFCFCLCPHTEKDILPPCFLSYLFIYSINLDQNALCACKLAPCPRATLKSIACYK